MEKSVLWMLVLGGLCTTGKNTTRQFQNNIISKMIVQTVHDQDSSDRFKCPQCHCTKGSFDTGSWGSLDILAASACNRVGKMSSKEDKVSRFTCPLNSCGYVAFILTTYCTRPWSIS